MNWFATEYLMRQQQTEIERSARDAWKWPKSQTIQWKQAGRFLLGRKLVQEKPAVCCVTCC